MKIVETRELVQIWVDRTYELKQDMTPEEFYQKYEDKDRMKLVEKVTSNWDKDTLKVIAVELPDDEIVEINSEFDWTVTEYSDKNELFQKVIRRMKRGICHFSFEMISNGRTKVAFGTIDPRCMPADKGRTPITISQSAGVPQTYWDLEANDWRSFLPTHLVTTV